MSYKFELWRFGICISTSSVSCSSLRLHVFFFDQIDSCRLSPVVSKASAGAMEVVDLLRLPGGMSETALCEVILVLIHYLIFFNEFQVYKVLLMLLVQNINMWISLKCIAYFSAFHLHAVNKVCSQFMVRVCKIASRISWCMIQDTSHKRSSYNNKIGLYETAAIAKCLEKKKWWEPQAQRSSESRSGRKKCGCLCSHFP